MGALAALGQSLFICHFPLLITCGNFSIRFCGSCAQTGHGNLYRAVAVAVIVVLGMTALGKFTTRFPVLLSSCSIFFSMTGLPSNATPGEENTLPGERLKGKFYHYRRG
jgi:hypothetical protein